MLTETVRMYSSKDFEYSLDHAKAVVLSALVADGLLDINEADEWGLSHSIIVKKKTMFKSLLSMIWEKTKEEKDTEYFLVVKVQPMATATVPVMEQEKLETVPTPEGSEEDTSSETD